MIRTELNYYQIELRGVPTRRQRRERIMASDFNHQVARCCRCVQPSLIGFTRFGKPSTVYHSEGGVGIKSIGS